MMISINSIFLLTLANIIYPSITSFHVLPLLHVKQNQSFQEASGLFSTTANLSETNVNQNLKNKIKNEISTTKRGLNASDAQQRDIEPLIQELEAQCPFSEPARSSLMGGKWIVDYTNAPPPSNGKLGPFVGVARQMIDLDEGTYVNYLSVPGDDLSKEWLSAKLEATFTEWDGTILKDDRIEDNTYGDESGDDKDESVEENELVATPKENDMFKSFMSMLSGNTSSTNKNTNDKPDYGAENWKVSFESIKIELFGIPIVTKKFENTFRIWKMSYLDEETRIVRAGRTGKDIDNMVFYMSRDDN
mmetsp:Transcript_26596/g.30933  ORF Transcript_26596/g.30933 Transcript_26596/m.30933 type:complete len:304 (+) Transcript_26596:68-979(+)